MIFCDILQMAKRGKNLIKSIMIFMRSHKNQNRTWFFTASIHFGIFLRERNTWLVVVVPYNLPLVVIPNHLLILLMFICDC